MSSNRPNFIPSFANQSNQYNSVFQTLYNQTNSLKKEYDTTSDVEMKSALRVVLNKKIQELQSITTTYASTMTLQIRGLVPN